MDDNGQVEVVTIPAGVIMPKDLLKWLRRRRDETQRELDDAGWDDRIREHLIGALETYQEVILHVSYD